MLRWLKVTTAMPRRISSADRSACRSEKARTRSGSRRGDLVEACAGECGDPRLQARFGRPDRVSRHADDAMPLSKKVQRLGGLLGEAHNPLRVATHVGGSGPGSRSANTNPSRSTISPPVDANRFAEHRAVPREGMELAAFAAGVNPGRKVVKQRRIELARHEPAIDGARVHAGEARPETAGDHLARQSRRVRSEQREEWRESTSDEFFLAIASDVLEEQVAERHVREAIGDGGAHCFSHHALVLVIRAGRRNRHHPEGQSQ